MFNSKAILCRIKYPHGFFDIVVLDVYTHAQLIVEFMIRWTNMALNITDLIYACLLWKITPRYIQISAYWCGT